MDWIMDYAFTERRTETTASNIIICVPIYESV